MNGPIGRRDLFRGGRQKAAQGAAKAKSYAEGWVRPPFSLGELDFLARCTRCDKCIEACPHEVLFPLPANFGRLAAGTPAMDLLHRACHMCTDWPCAAACAPGALNIQHEDEDTEQLPTAPKFAVAEIDEKICLPYLGPECGACASACPVPNALNWEDGIRPRIDQDVCTGCALCREACIADPKAIKISSRASYDSKFATGSN